MQRSSSNTNHMKRGIRPSSILCRQSTQFSYLLCFFSFPRFVIFFLFAAWPPYGRCFNGHRRIMNGLCYTYPETKPDLLRWHRRNANGSYYARFLPQKLPKTVLLRTAAHDFFNEFACYAQDLFPKRAGARHVLLCHLNYRFARFFAEFCCCCCCFSLSPPTFPPFFCVSSLNIRI